MRYFFVSKLQKHEYMLEIGKKIKSTFVEGSYYGHKKQNASREKAIFKLTQENLDLKERLHQIREDMKSLIENKY